MLKIIETKLDEVLSGTPDEVYRKAFELLHPYSGYTINVLKKDNGEKYYEAGPPYEYTDFDIGMYNFWIKNDPEQLIIVLDKLYKIQEILYDEPSLIPHYFFQIYSEEEKKLAEQITNIN